MPKIQQFFADKMQGSDISVHRAQADEFSNASGLNTLGQGLANAGESVFKRTQQDEVAGLATSMTKANKDFTGYLQQMQDAGKIDTDEFNQKVQDHFSQIGQNISTPQGQNFFERNSAKIVGNLQLQAMHSSSVLAGQKAIEDHQNTIENLSSSLTMNPATYESVKSVHDGIIDHLKETGLPASVAEKLRMQGDKVLGASAVEGWIYTDPKLARVKLESGDFDKMINGEQKFRYLNAAEVEKNRREKQAKDQLETEQMKTQDQLLAKIENGSATTRDILSSNLDPFGSGGKEQMLNILHSHVKEKAKSDPEVENDLFQRIHETDGDPTKITNENQLNEYVGQGLGITGLGRLRKEIQNLRTPEGLLESNLKKNVLAQAKKDLITGNLNSLPDPKGQANFNQFNIWFQQEYDKGRKAGLSATELTDPSSKHYLGKGISNFARSATDIIQDINQANTNQIWTPDFESSDIGVPQVPGQPNIPPPPSKPEATPSPQPTGSGPGGALGFEEWKKQRRGK